MNKRLTIAGHGLGHEAPRAPPRWSGIRFRSQREFVTKWRAR